jgi:methyl-accepting chemotaxis protein
MNFNQYKLVVRLVLGFLVIAIISLIIGGTGLIGIFRLSEDLYEISEVRLPSIEGLGIMNESKVNISRSENALLIPKLSLKERSEQYDKIKTSWTGIERGWKIYEPLPQTVEEASTWKKFEVAFATWKQDQETFIALSKKMDAVLQERPFDPAKDAPIYDAMIHQALDRNVKSLAEVDELLEKIIAINYQVAEEAKIQSVKDESFAQKLTIGMMVGGLATSIILGLLLAKSIAGPIQQIAQDLQAKSEQTSAAATQVSSASTALASGASEQAASLEETSSSMEEISSMVKQNANHTVEAQGDSGAVAKSVQESLHRMKELRETVSQVLKNSDEMTTSMNSIKQASDAISKIIKTIDEIAFQTNILALNAAVEAARAGEAGMGFAVVADEVRNLAKRSADAAKETADIIQQSIDRSNQGVTVNARMGETLSAVLMKAESVDNGLNDISSKTEKVQSSLSQIAMASNEQSQGIMQSNMAISQMDKVTQSNAASAEETAAAATELSSMAGALQESVTALISLVEGTHGNGGVSHTVSFSAHQHASTTSFGKKPLSLK